MNQGSLVSYKNYLLTSTFPSVIINMGTVMLFQLLLIKLMGVNMSGPMLGGILVTAGFSTTGRHLKNLLPVYFGLLISYLLGFWDLNQNGALIMFFLMSVLAPVAGSTSFTYGTVLTVISVSVVLITGRFHHGLSLHNTGFAVGFTIPFTIPVYNYFSNKRKKCKL